VWSFNLLFPHLSWFVLRKNLIVQIINFLWKDAICIDSNQYFFCFVVSLYIKLLILRLQLKRENEGLIFFIFCIYKEIEGCQIVASTLISCYFVALLRIKLPISCWSRDWTCSCRHYFKAFILVTVTMLCYLIK